MSWLSVGRMCCTAQEQERQFHRPPRRQSGPLSLFQRGHADSHFIFICKAKASYSTWASGAQLRAILQDCCTRASSCLGRLLSISISRSRWCLCRVGPCAISDHINPESSSVLEGCPCSPGTPAAGHCSWRPPRLQLTQNVHRLPTLLFPSLLLLPS